MCKRFRKDTRLKTAKRLECSYLLLLINYIYFGNESVSKTLFDYELPEDFLEIFLEKYISEFFVIICFTLIIL